MKKTFITLLALAGLASAAVEGDWTATFKSADTTITQAINTDKNDYTASFPAEGCPLTLKFTSLSTCGSTKSTGYNNAVQYNSTSIRPNINVCKGADHGYDLTFTLENTSGESIQINAITFNAFGYNSGGASHNQGGSPSADFSISYKLPNTTQAITLSNEEVGVYSSAEVKFSLKDSNTIYLAADEKCDITFKVRGYTTGGSFVGLSGATFSVIPEPTTATLSLLALCGLAARRRRK